MSPRQAWRRLNEVSGVVPGMAAVLVLGMLSVLRVLEPADRLYYDFVVDAIPQPATAAHEVLLVEAEPGARHAWKTLAERLVAAGAREVAFILPLDTGSLEALAASDQREKIRIGRPLVPSRGQPGTLTPAPIPEALAGRLKTAVVAVPANGFGFHRSQQGSFRAGDRSIPSIENAAAVEAGRPAPSDEFLVNFHRGFRLPRVRAERLEREAVLPELVAGRTVLVGYAAAPHLARFNGPGLPPGAALSQLEFHGLALDTLLGDKVIHTAGPVTRLGAVLAFGLLLILAFQPLRLFTAFRVTIALVAILPPLAWLTLRFLNVWPPVLELTLVAFLTLLLVYRGKARADDRRLRELFSETSRKLENRLLPKGFAESPEHWIYVVGMVDQTLQLDRAIFLERVPGDHRVREIQALRCSIEDIDEMRRDYTRSPYTDAIERGGTIEIDQRGRRPYLKLLASGDRQFLAPLSFGGEVLGFWAFSLAAERIGDAVQFRSVADGLADQIGHLLYHRELWNERHNAENRPWRRYLSDDTATLYGKLSRAIVALEERVSSFEQVFAESSTASIVFDLFGRVVLVNERMSDLLTRAGLAPFEMTAADLMERLAGRPPDSIRQTIQATLTDFTPAILQASLPGRNPGRFILYARALQSGMETAPARAPMRGSGLLLELIDVAELHRLYGIKSELVRHLNHQLDNDLATMLGAMRLVRTNPATKGEMLEVIDTQGREAAATLARVQELLAQEIDIDYGGSYPTDPRPAIEAAVHAAREAGAEREIGVDLVMQTTPFLVHANPRELGNTLGDLLAFLLADAVEGSRIRFELRASATHAELRLANAGFGLPQERLDSILAGELYSSGALFEELRLALHRVEKWGGSAAVRTGLGEGYEIILNLRTFR